MRRACSGSKRKTGVLKEMVADLNLDREALKAVIRKTGGACERAQGRGVCDERVLVQRTLGLRAPRLDRARYRYDARPDANEKRCKRW